MLRNSLKKYTDNVLFDEICTNFKLKNILSIENPKSDEYIYQFQLYKNYILSKITLFVNQCTYILIEKEYTESVWKEIFSLHYANTSYCNNNKVMRVHFFNSNICKNTKNIYNTLSESYLGYITLRPIPDFNLMLSFIVPNWNVLKYNEPNYIMTYKQVVHIFSYKVTIQTFAFYSQDSVVTTCAQADIIMFSTYTNKKYNHKMIKVSDIQDYMKYSPLPSKGLTGKEMLEIFRSNGSPVDYHLKKKIKTRGKTRKQHLMEETSYKNALNHITNILDSYIESRLPVIVYNAKHVILIIGHTSSDPKKYIIYDDSGVFLQQVVKKNNFIGTVSNRDLFPNNNDTTYLICATHGRIYLTAAEYDGFVLERINGLGIDKKNIIKKRNIIIDNTDLKSHLLLILNSEKDIDNELRKNIIDLINSNLPHYLWYTELHLNSDIMLILIGDTTYPVNTHLDIFKLTFYVSSNYQLKLLTYNTI